MGGVTALREFIWGYTTLAAMGISKVSSMKPRGTVVASIVGYVEINGLLLQNGPRSGSGVACVVGYLDINVLILKDLTEGLRCRNCCGKYSGIS